MVTITLKNYRCFEDARPASITVGPGFTGLIGSNNSGKSSFLRFFVELRNLLSVIGPTTQFLAMCRGNQHSVGAQYVADPSEIACDRNDRPTQVGLAFTDSRGAPSSHIDFTLENSRSQPDLWTAIGGFSDSSADVRKGSIFDGPVLRCGKIGIDFTRAFEVIEPLAQTMYVGPFRNAINEGAGSYYDLAIGTSFVNTWRNWKSGNVKAHNRQAEAITEDIRRIFDFRKLEINATEDAKTLQVNVDGRPYKLAEHGAGLAQFIIVLANAAIRRPAYILIDEPELNLHPSLQIDFLTRLASYSTHGVIFATHSIGLGRAVAERLYSFQRSERGSVVRPFLQTPNYAEFLGELSFSSFKELGFDTILLVEGGTDVKTFQQLLRLFHKEHQVVILPLGGDQLAKGGMEYELAEIKRLSDNIAVIVDSERTAANAPPSKPRQEFQETCAKLGFRICITDRLAVENYLTDNAIKAEKGEKYRALGHFEKLADTPVAWGKHENWRIASRMVMADLDGTDVGRFLAAL